MKTISEPTSQAVSNGQQLFDQVKSLLDPIGKQPIVLAHHYRPDAAGYAQEIRVNTVDSSNRVQFLPDESPAMPAGYVQDGRGQSYYRVPGVVNGLFEVFKQIEPMLTIIKVRFRVIRMSVDASGLMLTVENRVNGKEYTASIGPDEDVARFAAKIADLWVLMQQAPRLTEANKPAYLEELNDRLSDYGPLRHARVNEMRINGDDCQVSVGLPETKPDWFDLCAWQSAAELASELIEVLQEANDEQLLSGWHQQQEVEALN